LRRENVLGRNPLPKQTELSFEKDRAVFSHDRSAGSVVTVRGAEGLCMLEVGLYSMCSNQIHFLGRGIRDKNILLIDKTLHMARGSPDRFLLTGGIFHAISEDS
jgi:hypothetical protein